MRATFLGQAGLFIETRAGSILCDPWFSPAYFGSWFPFPANDGIDPSLIGNPTYLYISHLHHDHFDPAWLSRHVNKDATVLLPDYLIDDLRHELHALGFRRFVETADGEPIELAGGLKVMIEALTAPTDGPIGDSALVVDDGQTRLLNMNDSRPPDPDKLLAMGPIDLLFLQFSGAIWYPMVYEFPERAKITLAHKKRVVQLARAQRYIEILDPAFVVPSAGPPCFLDDDLFEYNDLARDPSNIFPDQEVFLDYLAGNGIRGGKLMLPGSVGELTPSSFEVSHPIDSTAIRAIFDDREAYLRAYQARVRPLLDAEHARWLGPTPEPGEPAPEPLDLLTELKAWFEPLMTFGELTCSGIGAPVLLDLRGPQGLTTDPGRPAGRDRPRFRRPARPALGRGRNAPLHLPDRPAADRDPRPRARGGLGQFAVPVDALPGRPQGSLQRVRLHLVQVPRPGAAPVRRGLLRREGQVRGLVRDRRLGGPAALPAHEGRPDPLRHDRGRCPDLLAPRLAVRAGDRPVPHLGRPRDHGPAAERGGASRPRSDRRSGGATVAAAAIAGD